MSTTTETRPQFITAGGARVYVGDTVRGQRYEGTRQYTISVTGYSSGPGMVHGRILRADGTLAGKTDLSVQTVEPVNLAHELERQLDEASLGAMLVQDTTEHGVQIVAVLLYPGTACPWLRVTGNSLANGGALAQMHRALPNLRVVSVDLAA